MEERIKNELWTLRIHKNLHLASSQFYLLLLNASRCCLEPDSYSSGCETQYQWLSSVCQPVLYSARLTTMLCVIALSVVTILSDCQYAHSHHFNVFDFVIWAHEVIHFIQLTQSNLFYASIKWSEINLECNSRHFIFSHLYWQPGAKMLRMLYCCGWHLPLWGLWH